MNEANFELLYRDVEMEHVKSVASGRLIPVLHEEFLIVYRSPKQLAVGLKNGTIIELEESVVGIKYRYQI